MLGPRGEYVVFTVRNRRVRDLNFNLQITCQVSAEIKFGTRDVFNASVIVPEDRSGLGPEDAAESCDGVSSLRFHRGFELPVP